MRENANGVARKAPQFKGKRPGRGRHGDERTRKKQAA